MDEDLEKHIIEKQIVPQQIAAQHDGMDTFFVSTNPDEERGITVTCVSCGKTAQMFGISEKDIAQRVVLCPECIRR
jgi:hypothetical protein